MGDPLYLQYPNLALAQSVFTLASPTTHAAAKHSALDSLQNAIRNEKMAPLYAYLAHPQTGKLSGNLSGGLSPTLSRATTNTSTHVSSTAPPFQLLRRTSSINAPSIVGVLGGKTDTSVALPWDESLYNSLTAANDAELDTIRKEEEEATEKAGETEVTAAQSKRAELYARIGDKTKALEEFEKLMEKTGILGTKIDIALAIIRIGLFFDDKLLVRRTIDRAQALVDSGGDWDRRNRLKAYRGLHLLTIRAYAAAAPLLLDSLSTFTSTELCPYASLVVYAALAGTVSLPRRDFKSKVVDAPEIRAVFGVAPDSDNRLAGGEDQPMPDSTSTAPKPVVNLTALASGSSSSVPAQPEPEIDFSPVATLIQSLYAGEYSAFFGALAAVEIQFLSQDRFLYEHKAWLVREMRLRAYAQLLQSYRTVGLEAMAARFGVSVAWLDRDLAPLIASQRLPATIDRVQGVIETRRSDDKNRQYNDMVKEGDHLITKLQKFAQVVRLRGTERS